MDLSMQYLAVSIMFVSLLHDCFADLKEKKQLPMTGGYTLDSRHLFIGNLHGNSSTNIDVGSVTLYPRYGTDIDFSVSRTISPDDGTTGDQFGFNIKVNDDYLLVLAPGTDGTNPTIYVYEYNQQLELKKKFAPNGCVVRFHYGFEQDYIDINENNDIVIGCIYSNPEGKYKRGAAYVYTYNISTANWATPQRLYPATKVSDKVHHFGQNPVMNRNMVVMAQSGHHQERRVYIFKKNGDKWIENQILKPVHGYWANQFGVRIVISDDFLFVSEPWHDSDWLRIYEKDGNERWVLKKSMRSSGVGTPTWYGSGTAYEHNILVVGAYHFDNGYKSTGAVWIHEYNSVTKNWDERRRLALSDKKANDQFSAFHSSLSDNLVVVGGSWQKRMISIFDITSLVSYRPPPFSFSRYMSNRLTCRENSFQVAISRGSFPDVVASMDVVLNDERCNSSYTMNRSHLLVGANFSTCGHTVVKTSDKIIQGNTININVKFNGQGGMILTEKLTYNINCGIGRNVSVSGGNRIHSLVTKITSINLNEDVDFQVSMNVYTNSSYETVAGDPLFINPPEPLFFSIEEQYEGLTFVVEECFVTPAADFNNILTTIFDTHNQCAKDESFAIIEKNDSRFQFRVNSFEEFVEVRNIIVHCGLYICEVNDTSATCQQRCLTNRQRRNAMTETETGDARRQAIVTVHSPEIILVRVECRGDSCSAKKDEINKKNLYISVGVGVVVAVGLLVLLGVTLFKYNRRVNMIGPTVNGEVVSPSKSTDNSA